MKYQLAVAHRVCPKLAKTAIAYKDKLSLVKATTESLAKSLAGIPAKLVVILDGCGPEYEETFDRVFAGGRVAGVDYERRARRPSATPQPTPSNSKFFPNLPTMRKTCTSLRMTTSTGARRSRR